MLFQYNGYGYRGTYVIIGGGSSVNRNRLPIQGGVKLTSWTRREHCSKITIGTHKTAANVRAKYLQLKIKKVCEELLLSYDVVQ